MSSTTSGFTDFWSTRSADECRRSGDPGNPFDPLKDPAAADGGRDEGSTLDSLADLLPPTLEPSMSDSDPLDRVVSLDNALDDELPCLDENALENEFRNHPDLLCPDESLFFFPRPPDSSPETQESTESVETCRRSLLSMSPASAPA